MDDNENRSPTAPLGVTNAFDTTTEGFDDEYQSHWNLYPKSYTVYKLPPHQPKYDDAADDNSHTNILPLLAFPIDGNIEKDIWKIVPWSDSFGDIQGKDEPEPKTKIPMTQFKAIYDDSYLYIAAILHPATGLTTEAHFTERNSPIYQRDSDFEVFIDVDNTNHMYKELEVNAINTIWNLLLDKPYEDGGVEHSGRIAKIGESRYYDVSYQYTATKIISGTLNNESNHTGALWSVEMALSFDDILSNTTLLNRNYSPTHSSWRVNFSRVEKQGKMNWTWQPQRRWNPEARQFSGFVQMHMPDAWGYFYFSEELIGSSVAIDETSSIPTSRLTQINDAQSPSYKDPLWPEKLTAMTIYYALHYYKNQNGRFTDKLSELLLPIEIVAPFCCEIQLVQSDEKNNEGFVVLVNKKSDRSTSTVRVRDDRLLQIIWTSIAFHAVEPIILQLNVSKLKD